jgi:hypothetical protein
VNALKSNFFEIFEKSKNRFNTNLRFLIPSKRANKKNTGSLCGPREWLSNLLRRHNIFNGLPF